MTRGGTVASFALDAADATAAAALCRDMFTAYDVVQFVYVSRAWVMRSSSHPASEQIRPSQSERREEALILIAVDGEQAAAFMAPIDRPFDGSLPTAGQWSALPRLPDSWLEEMLPVPYINDAQREALRVRLKAVVSVAGA